MATSLSLVRESPFFRVEGDHVRFTGRTATSAAGHQVALLRRVGDAEEVSVATTTVRPDGTFRLSGPAVAGAGNRIDRWTARIGDAVSPVRETYVIARRNLVRPGAIGAYVVGTSSSDLREQGLIRQIDPTDCDVVFEATRPVFTEFRRSNDERLDLAGAESSAAGVFRTRTGATPSLWTVARLKRDYGDRVRWVKLRDGFGGTYRTFLLTTERGKLLFLVARSGDPAVTGDTQVQAIYATGPTTPEPLGPWVYGSVASSC